MIQIMVTIPVVFDHRASWLYRITPKPPQNTVDVLNIQHMARHGAPAAHGRYETGAKPTASELRPDRLSSEEIIQGRPRDGQNVWRGQKDRRTIDCQDDSYKHPSFLFNKQLICTCRDVIIIINYYSIIKDIIPRLQSRIYQVQSFAYHYIQNRTFLRVFGPLGHCAIGYNNIAYDTYIFCIVTSTVVESSSTSVLAGKAQCTPLLLKFFN